LKFLFYTTMKFSLLGLMMLSLITLGFGQEEKATDIDKRTREKTGANPTIGIGAGVVKFYGDLNDKDYGSPFTANTSFNLYLIQPINDYLNLRLNFFQSTLKEEERSLERNLNYENKISAFAAMVEYNFDHFLDRNGKVVPFVTTGIEIVNFNPKTDLFNAAGEHYNYWSDGTIRNISESAPNAEQSVIIQRDFSYETDLKESGLNGSTTFNEFTFSIPVGVGVDLRLNDNFNLKFESVMHFGFTDDMEGVSTRASEELVQNKRPNGRNDFFFYNGVSVSYNFDKIKPAEPFEKELNDAPIDYLASGNTEDFDQDGVIDLIDQCPNTASNITVDSLGCPVDSDGDGVPDYKDEEVNTEYPEFANQKGVEMTDEMIYKSYMRFNDSTLEFAETIERDFSRKKKTSKTKYLVKAAEYKKGETPPDMERLLSLSDLSKLDQGDHTIYTAGKYQSVRNASNRAKELRKNGFEDADVLQKNKDGKYKSVPGLKLDQKSASTPTTDGAEEKEAGKKVEENQIVFRVQLGAFRNKPSAENYQKIPNLFIEESNGFFRYMSGSFDSFNQAAKHKVKMIVEGYKGAFVVAYKGGKRVSLKSVGVESLNSDPIIGK